MEVRGASAKMVRAALRADDPLPGTTGFAGAIDGRLIRDVLGRQPLFFDPSADRWSFDPTDLSTPAPVPAGYEYRNGRLRRCWSLPQFDPVADDEAVVAALRDALEVAFDFFESARGPNGPAVQAGSNGSESNLAIAFSGGVDSALIAAALGAPLYCVGFPDSHDVRAARRATARLDSHLEVVELDHSMLELAIPRVARATGRTNAMDVQIALGPSLVAARVRADGYDSLALGQGADELFGGYAKIANAPADHRVEANTVRGARREVLQSLPDQVERDVLAVRDRGVEPVFPLLHDEIVRVALGLAGEQLIRSDGIRKWAFREAARAWLPDELATREKKAMQYGSLIAREVDRLARQAGYKRRLDDHVTRYVESLLHG